MAANQPAHCESCGRELQDGENGIVRVQTGKIYYVKHTGIARNAVTDYYFCRECIAAGNGAIRTGVF